MVRPPLCLCGGVCYPLFLNFPMHFEEALEPKRMLKSARHCLAFLPCISWIEWLLLSMDDVACFVFFPVFFFFSRWYSRRTLFTMLTGTPRDDRTAPTRTLRGASNFTPRGEHLTTQAADTVGSLPRRRRRGRALRATRAVRCVRALGTFSNIAFLEGYCETSSRWKVLHVLNRFLLAPLAPLQSLPPCVWPYLCDSILVHPCVR